MLKNETIKKCCIICLDINLHYIILDAKVEYHDLNVFDELLKWLNNVGSINEQFSTIIGEKLVFLIFLG